MEPGSESIQVASAQIVEGYCLRKHKNEFLLYLNRACASAEETIEHLELLSETRSLLDKSLYQHLRDEYEQLCGKLFRFIQSAGESHELPLYLKEDGQPYEA